MAEARSFVKPEDEQHIIEIRRTIHQHPEIGFELPETVKTVEAELTRLGIPYTEKYGKSSVAAYIGFGAGFDPEAADEKLPDQTTIALRADMDALAVFEKVDVPFKSLYEGKMHACGHDTHTAALLGAAAILKRAEAEGLLKARVKLIFQPAEESETSGAAMMIENGVLNDVDYIFGMHSDPQLPTGTIATIPGNAMAACHPYTVDFYGKSVHATLPQNGKDALAMAVDAYNQIYLMKSRIIDPFEEHVLSVSTLHAGTAHNILADHAQIKISFRFYNPELNRIVDEKIKEICRNSAALFGGTVEFSDRISCWAVINDPELTEQTRLSAVKVVGSDHTVPGHKRMSSEDFGNYLNQIPGTFARFGCGCSEKGCGGFAHQSEFHPDEDSLMTATLFYAQVALDA